MVLRENSLELSHWVTGHDKSPRCLSAILQRIALYGQTPVPEIKKKVFLMKFWRVGARLKEQSAIF